MGGGSYSFVAYGLTSAMGELLEPLDKEQMQTLFSGKRDMYKCAESLCQLAE